MLEKKKRKLKYFSMWIVKKCDENKFSKEYKYINIKEKTMKFLICYNSTRKI